MLELPVVYLHLPVDAVSGKPLYPDGDEIGKPLGFPEIDYKTTVVFAVEFVNRELMPDLSWNLTIHPCDTGKVYALSGGCDRSADLSPMFHSDAAGINLPGDWPDGTDPDPALGRFTFRFRTDNPRFAEIAAHPELQKFCSATVTVSTETDSAVAARIPFRPKNRTGEFAGGGGTSPEGGMTLNGLSGTVVLTDAKGVPLPVSGQTIAVPDSGGSSFDGLFPDRNPVAELPVDDIELGMCHYLDTTFPQISFAWPVCRLRKITALIRSVNPAVAGTVVMAPVVDGNAQESVTLMVGASWSEVVIPLTVETGEIVLRRDAGGTLVDGGMVTAVLRCITLWEEI